MSRQLKLLWEHFLHDNLFRNSIYLMLATAIMSFFGFIFWVICSRLFDPRDIGLATAFISTTSLVSGFSMLGFNNAIIRFLSKSDKKDEQISTAFIITTGATLLVGLIFLLWIITTHSPIIGSNSIFLWASLFILYLCINNMNTIVESVFIAYRETIYVVLKNTLFSVLKTVLPVLLIATGSFAIIDSIVIASAASLVIGVIWLVVKFNYRPILSIDTEILRGIYRFAAGNYIGNLFGILPATLVPIIILSRLGAKEAAFFYMPMMLIAFLNIIPSASTQSLFAEVSHNEKGAKKYFRSSIKHLFLLMIPASIAIALFGGFVLNFFGTQYAQEGTLVLQILVIASLVGALNYFGDTLLNVKKQMISYVFMNAVGSLVIVILTFFAAPYGLTAIAFAWLVGQVVTLAVYMVIHWKLVKELIG